MKDAGVSRMISYGMPPVTELNWIQTEMESCHPGGGGADS